MWKRRRLQHEELRVGPDTAAAKCEDYFGLSPPGDRVRVHWSGGIVQRTPLTRGLAGAVCALLACGKSETPSGDPKSKIADTRSSPAATRSADDFPAFGCVDSVASEAALFEVAAVGPPERRRSSKPQDADWLPERIADVAVLPNGFAVLDAGAREVSLFSLDFTRRTRWGRAGSGPAEFRSPVAIAGNPGGDIVWVLDTDPARLVAFGLDGTFLHSLSLPTSGGSDLAIDDAGRFLVAKPAVSWFMEPDTTGTWNTVVTRYDQQGRLIDHLVRVSEDDFPSDRFVLSGPNPIRVSARGARVAVYYPVSGIVDVYSGGKLEMSAHVCVPTALRARYSEQRAAMRKSGNSETWLPLVTGVLLNDNGTVAVVSPSKTREKLYHIDRFDRRGRSLGSIVFSSKYIALPMEVMFMNSDTTLVAFEDAGVIASFALRKMTVPAP